MSNYESIKPYSEIVHEAAINGGPEQFLRKHAEANRQLGVEAEKETEGWKAAVLTVIVVAAWEGVVKPTWRWAKKRHVQRKEQALAKSKAAEEELLRCMKAAIDTDSNYAST